PKLAMIRVIWTCVILECVQLVAQPECTYAAPAQITEVDDQIGGDGVHLRINLLGTKGSVPHRAASVIRNRLQFRNDPISNVLILPGRDEAWWFPSTAIPQNPAVCTYL